MFRSGTRSSDGPGAIYVVMAELSLVNIPAWSIVAEWDDIWVVLSHVARSGEVFVVGRSRLTGREEGEGVGVVRRRLGV